MPWYYPLWHDPRSKRYTLWNDRRSKDEGVRGLRTRAGQLSQDLAKTNPWWRLSDWQGRDADLRRARDSGLGHESRVLDDLVEGNLYVLRGPRRVGKTVAVKQTISRLLDAGVAPRSIVRVAADGLDEADIRQLPQSPGLPRSPDGVSRWWFIDEVSAVKGDWATQIKWLRDNDPDFANATVVLTGSDSTALTQAIGQLPGRRGRNIRTGRTLLPIGFRTFMRLLDPEAPDTGRVELPALRSQDARTTFDELTPWLDILVRGWDAYLEFGGFPASVAALARGDAVPEDFVNDLFEVVFRDAFAASSLSESRTSALYSRLMTGMGSPISSRAVAVDLDLTHPTVERHLSYLRHSLLAWTCPPRSIKGWLPLERGQEKLYATDPLLARLMHLRIPALPDIDPSVLTEMQLGVVIRRRQADGDGSWTGDERLFYWRTPTRKEVDFVSEDLGGTAIESKYTEGDGWRREAATVNASEWDGILATRNVLDTRSRDEAWAVPAAFLAYVIDT